jgi:DeoR/GlpR family transcriptional regulator of sugar metabolism
MHAFDEQQREQAILLELEASGRVSVKELAARFGVSTVTVRKDLDALESRSLLRRVRGGAVTAGTTDEGAFALRLRHGVEAKRAVARRAARLVRHGDVIAMDSSTTCFYLAHELLDRHHLVVVTNGLRTAALFMERSSAMVLMPGGTLRRSSGSMVGPIGRILSGRGQIEKGFFGVVGISTEHGLMDIAVEEAQTKAYLAESCRQVYGVFDSSKVGRFAVHSFAPVGSVDGLYTDDRIDPSVVREWAALGVPIHTAPVPEPAEVATLALPAVDSGSEQPS